MNDLDLMKSISTARLPLAHVWVGKIDELPEDRLAVLLAALQDEVLADLVQQGNDLVAETAFNLLEADYRASTKRRVRAKIREAADVDDVVQETWLAVWFALRYEKKFDPSRRLSPYLNRILTWKIIDRLRVIFRGRENEIPSEDLESDDKTDAATFRHEFWSLFHRLPPLDQSYLWHRYIEGCSIRELADAHNVTAYRVRVELTEAERRFRSHLTKKKEGK